MSDLTQEIPTELSLFQLRGFYALWLAFPGAFAYKDKSDIGLLQPRIRRSGLGYSRFARRYSGNLD